MAHILARVLVVAAVATLADLTWYSLGVRHTLTAGVIHGALVLTAVGAALGAASGHLGRGLPIGAVAGIAGALTYYALVALVDRRTYGSAIPVAWVMTWLYLAALDGRWLRAPARRSWGAVAARGLVAAVGGGLAFYLVMNTLWGRPPASGRNYLVQWLAWAFAWAPGIAALSAGGGSRSPVRQPVSATGGHAGDEGVARITHIDGPTLARRLETGEIVHILDVRTEGEFAAGRVPTAISIPFSQVGSRLGDVPGGPDDELVLYCGHGPRAYIAAASLRRSGPRRIVYLEGHWAAWTAAGLPVERS